LEEITGETAAWYEVARQLSRDEPKPKQDPVLERALVELQAKLGTMECPSAPSPAEDAPETMLDPPVHPGHLGRLGQYEIVELVGRGGMGVVWKGIDPALNRSVAIKVLAPQLATSAAARKRFSREAQIAAGISHENVVTIYAVAEARGLPYLVMQYVAGRSLQQRLASAEPLELEEVVRIGRQTAAGLAAAHAGGVIHRDIKPANILLEPAGADVLLHGCLGASGKNWERVKISDFGLARAIDDTSLSQQGVVAGTPQYMSPEQIAGSPTDHRSDLYSLGVLLYRMAAGREPFLGPTTASIWAQQLADPPPPLAEIAPGSAPAWLEKLIFRLLQKDAAARPQSAEEVVHHLDEGFCSIPVPADEEKRLAALRRYRILDTDPEQGFDDLTSLASYVCGTPIALITLVDADRQWFKSKVGLSMRQTSRSISFCGHTILGKDVLLVPDALADQRFAGSPLVSCDPHVRFYAGIPLVAPDGHALGALCVMDREPRHLTPEQLTALATLGRLAVTQLELRRNLLELKEAELPGK
jgi:serine/threonine protein kinase